MAIANEMFRFVTTRQPERLALHRIDNRLVRDLRPVTSESLLVELFGKGEFETKLETAETFLNSGDFLAADAPEIIAVEPGAEFFRTRLQSELVLADLYAELQASFPDLALLLAAAPSQQNQQLEATAVFLGRVWDSLYALVTLGGDRFVSTNYLADTLRVFQILRLLWMSRTLDLHTWQGGVFDDYEILIDVKKALSIAKEQNDTQGPSSTDQNLPDFDEVKQVEEEIAELVDAANHIDQLMAAGAVTVSKGEVFLDVGAAEALKGHPSLEEVDVTAVTVAEVQGQLQMEHRLTEVKRQRLLATPPEKRAQDQLRSSAASALARSTPPAPRSAAPSTLAGSSESFRVPLSVGEILPPVVGDLILVEQELRCYELGELADIQSIMRGERRERSHRDLSRTTETTTTEMESEREETESLSTDERFQLSSQAQTTASQTFSVDAGVSVSGKFGPVQVGATANASYSTSKSSTESTAQEYAKTVTEEASKRVRDSIKETSSITLLTESQTTSLQGFNNEKGADHVNGLYRWVDKIYTARTLNYGRRLMLSFSVPEPAAFFRSLMAQNEADLLEGLEEPYPPSMIAQSNLEPVTTIGSGATRPGSSSTSVTFDSYHEIDADNYAELAALYDVTDLEPLPPDKITGAKAISYPQAMEAAKIDEHDDANELSYVGADNTLSIDPDYLLTRVGVFASKGASGAHKWYADVLKLGENKNKKNMLLVQVGNKSFYFMAEGQGNNDPKNIDTNFNTTEEIDETQLLGGVFQNTLPVSISCDFEGIVSFTVIYTAFLRDEALDRWRIATFDAILKGYERKKQAYDQALKLAEAEVQSEVEARTYQLRDDQYRNIELTELKRGCIDLLTTGTAIGHTSIAVDPDGATRIVYDEAEGSLLGNWRSPLSNGVVAGHFEECYDWQNATYAFYPYYWADQERWKELAEIGGGDPVFDEFLKAGSANVLVPVKPGYERPVVFFLKTGLIWGGAYMPLFTDQEMLEIYSDVELAEQLDPPEQVGDAWDIRLPTSMIMLQEDSELPKFPAEEEAQEPLTVGVEPAPDETVPF